MSEDDQAISPDGVLTVLERPAVERIITSVSGCGYGNGRINTVCTAENTAVLAPMASASVSTMIALVPGCRPIMRAAWRRSYRSVSIQNLRGSYST